jgi:hypothetical protein
LLRHLALVFDPERPARIGNNDRFALGIVAMRAKHLPIVFAVVAVLVVARDDVIDLDAGPTGKATGPTAIALRADGFFGLGGEFVALRHVSISVVDVTNIGAPPLYVNRLIAFFFAFFAFFKFYCN